MQNNNVTTVKGNYNSNQNQMNRQQGIKGQNNINPNTQITIFLKAIICKIILISLEYL